jgi:hypothetical protein
MNMQLMQARTKAVAGIASGLLLATGLIGAAGAWAGDNNNGNNNGNNGGLNAVPFEFVGTASECGGVPGSRIVTSRWLNGMGLPDNAGPNTVANAKDPRFGLLLSKNGLTADCSAAGARIQGVKGMKVTATSTLGFDYRNGGHCGAGAPRFNVTTRTGVFSFVGGCANGVPAPAPQDPAQWTRVRFLLVSPSTAFPPLTVGDTIESISIIFDEGTDTPSAQDPNGVGLAVVDNIEVNGRLITRGSNPGSGDDDENDD